jgi:DNA-binding winged helix-turn-helix (wHTH) protein/tetratricopeptide (TPR) repeat protein
MRTFRLGERLVDLTSSTVLCRGEVTQLTAIEAKLLRHLVRRAGEVVPREELLVEVWGYKPGVQSRTVDNTTIRLRQKIEDDPRQPAHLVAVYGQGLRLDGAVPEAPPGSTGFVGRQAELARIGAAFRGGSRLVTLVGPAGVGKSRTASEAVLRLGLEPIEVACGAIHSALDLDTVVRAALGPAAASGPLGPALARAPQGLLLLDECELAPEPIARRAAEWLADAPSLKILATSRVRLGLPQEHVVALDPLEPDEAAALFLACMQRAAPSVPADEAAVQRVVGLLEGLPLALELAAARCPVVGLQKLEGLLGAPLGVLGGPGRRSMGEVLERSFEALEPAQRRALTDLSVFEATFDLEDAAAVLDTHPTQALDRVEGLFARSLLRVEPDGRYALYAVVRERARQDLAPDDPACDRHARWLARLGVPELLLSHSFDTGTLRRALPDLRVALARVLPGEPALAERCGLAVVWHLAESGREEAIALGEQILAIAQTPRIRLYLALWMARQQETSADRAGALARLEAATALATHPHDIVRVYCALAIYRRNLGDREGAQHDLEHARPYAPRAGAIHAHWLSVAGTFQRGTAEGERLVREAARVARRHGDRGRELVSLVYLLGHVDRGEDWEELDVLSERLLELCAEGDLPMPGRAFALHTVGGVKRFRGDLDEAERLLEEALELAQRAGMGEPVRGVRLQLARLWMQQGRLEDARLELEPLTWETAHPSITAGEALMVWADLLLREDVPARAAVALRQAMDHARVGKWKDLEVDVLDLLAVATGDPSHLDAAAALDTTLAGRVRRAALASVVAAQRGEVPQAQAFWEQAHKEALRLEMGPDSEVAFWMGRAERAIGLAEGRVLPGVFRTVTMS